jgi:hypothetical protein
VVLAIHVLHPDFEGELVLGDVVVDDLTVIGAVDRDQLETFAV